MLKGAGKGRHVLSFGRGGVSTFADGKRGPSPKGGLTADVTTPFSRLESNIWLHDRTEIDVYQLLIDTYRLHVVQDQKDNKKREYPEDPINSFKAFLKLFDNKPELLPEWWTEEKAEECVKLGEGERWSSLHRMIVKDVIEHYGESLFAIQLR